MSDTKDKLEKLKEQIKQAAELDAKKMTDDAEKHAKAMLDEEKAIIEKEQSGAMLAKISKYENDERKRTAESRYAADRKVLLHRNALVDGLFDEIKEELASFTGSDKYRAHLEKCAECADKQEKLGGTAIVYCKKSDRALAEAVTKKYGLSVETDRNILIGGLMFRYPEKGIIIDLTLDTAFASQREAFAAKSEMQL